MPKEKLIKKSDLIPDNKNFNKGSQLGQELIKKSISKFGAGRSILIDKNNRIIAGNKTTENFEGEDVLVIETTGEKLIAVKRTDIDLDSPEGREMALADNATAKENIFFDAELIEAEVLEAVYNEWINSKYSNGSEFNNLHEDEFDINEDFDPIGEAKDLHKVIFIFDNEIEAGKYFDENIKGLIYKKYGGSQNKQWQVNLSTKYGK